MLDRDTLKATIGTLKNRLRLFKWWILKRSVHKDIGLSDIVARVTKSPYRMLAKKYIKSITAMDDDYEIQLLGLKRNLYWPITSSIHDISQVIVEILDPSHWHYYEAGGTVVAPGDIVLDCGASEGLFTLSVLNRAGKVFAAEPSPYFHRCFKRTFRGVKNCELLPFALGASSGTLCMDGDKTISGKIGTKNGIKVPVVTLDSLFVHKGQSVDFIKIDLEGFEMELLRGAENTIRTYQPKIAITTYHNENRYLDIKNFILSLVPKYHVIQKGINEDNGHPVMLHFNVGLSV